MSASGYTIYMIEDDASVRDALGLLLSLKGYPVAMFTDAPTFLAAYRNSWKGCLLIDIRMPEMDGLTLQKTLLESGCSMPVIIMTGHGSVESAREAFRSRAVDFLEKPIDHGRLIHAIDEAFNRQTTALDRQNQRSAFDQALSALTPREREVMERVVTGRHNREIAEELGISVRTVEVHKARMMTKLGVDTVPDLVRLSLVSGPLNSSK